MEMNRANEQHQQEVTNLKRILEKAYLWLPSFKRFLNMEHVIDEVASLFEECLQFGFSEEQTDKLMLGSTIAAGFTPMSTYVMLLPIMFRHK